MANLYGADKCHGTSKAISTRLFGELCRSSFTLENRSTIFLDYKICVRSLISNAGKGSPTINALAIKPNKGCMDPLSSIKIEIEFRPMLLGAFEIKFELQKKQEIKTQCNDVGDDKPKNQLPEWDKKILLKEDRAAEALTRYYGVKEILLPPRKLGERMPSFLIEFYNSLMSEMAYALSSETIEDKSVTTLNDSGYENRIRATRKSSSTSKLSAPESSSQRESKIDLQKGSDRWKVKKSTSYSSTSIESVKRDCLSMSVFNELDFPREPPILSTSNSEKLQSLLLCYIETLRKDPNLYEKMRDPVKDLFESPETVLIQEPGFDSSQPAKKVCIIFHGAPFTEYQETACISAKILQVPLLYIDNVIIEGIALGDKWFSIKLRQIIDDAYQEYLSTFKKHKDILEIKLPVTRKIDAKVVEHNQETTVREESLEPNRTKLPKQQKSSKTIKSNSETATKIEYTESNAQELITLFEMEFSKLPTEQDLQFLDPVSLYECKIQTILLLQRIFSCYSIVESKVSKKSAEKSQNDIFLDIESGLLIEVFRERLSSHDFKSGFVLQTLNNIFFKSDVITLLVLLNIVGYVEYALFVTFLNSMDTYVRKMKKLHELKETAKKIQEIDEMSLSEYELLAENDKKFYLESTLPIKKQEALQRRMQFVQQMTEMRKRKVFTSI
nr:PREDICTED: uncharacterized protein LOC105679292 [Linepithema humile]